VLLLLLLLLLLLRLLFSRCRLLLLLRALHPMLHFDRSHVLSRLQLMKARRVRFGDGRGREAAQELLECRVQSRCCNPAAGSQDGSCLGTEIFFSHEKTV
jgi:hypothetical protein